IAGDQNVESTVVSIPAGVAQAFKVTAQKAKMMTNIQVYLDASSTATSLVAGIYTNNTDGHPGSLWRYVTLNGLKAGAWNSVAISPLNFPAGYTYWMAVLGNGGMLNMRGQADDTGLTETSASSVLKGLPSTWSTGSVTIYGPVSAYVSGY
ncbi:MAG: hypothetical protein WCH01_10665, partial [Methylococcaceae bacterium]